MNEPICAECRYYYRGTVLDLCLICQDHSLIEMNEKETSPDWCPLKEKNHES